jgi:ElaB/YqjD/DUF883 family membrane-anchored ribosome-binding protein
VTNEKAPHGVRATVTTIRAKAQRAVADAISRGGTTMPERDLQKEFDELRNELSKLQEDLGRVAEQGGTVAKDAATLAVERIEAEAQRLIEKIQDTAEAAGAKGKELVSDVEHRVEEKPVSSALTALGVGLIIGIILSRR